MLIKLMTVTFMYHVLENVNNTGTSTLAFNFIQFLKAFCNVDFARKSLSMVHKTFSTLV